MRIHVVEFLAMDSGRGQSTVAETECDERGS